MMYGRSKTSAAQRPGYFLWAALVILLAGFFVRVWQLGDASLWVDETVTDFRVQKSVSQTFNYLADNASQGPFYYLVLHLFPRSDELQLRLVSVWAAVLGIALFIFAAVRLYDNYNYALLAGALLAFNPYHVWLSRTARAYSLLFTLALLSSFLFLMLLRGHRSRGLWALFIVSSMAAYVTHHFALVLPFAQYILFAFILRGNRGLFRQWLAAQLIAGIPLGLYVLRIMLQDTVAVGAGWIPVPRGEDLLLTLWNLLVGYDGTLYWYVVPGLVVGGICLAVGLVAAWREQKADRVTFYWFWLFVATLGGGFLISVTFHPFYVDRYFIVCLPAVLFLLLKGAFRLSQQQYVGMISGGIVMLSGVCSIIVVIGNGTYEREAWRSAASYIEAEEITGDGLLVEMPNKLVALRYYLKQDIDYAWLDGGLGAETDLASQFDAPLSRLWVVFRNPFDDGHRQNLMPDFDPFAVEDSALSEWLAARRDQVITEQEFNGVTVLLVDVRGEPYGVGN